MRSNRAQREGDALPFQSPGQRQGLPGADLPGLPGHPVQVARRVRLFQVEGGRDGPFMEARAATPTFNAPAAATRSPVAALTLLATTRSARSPRAARIP